MQIYLTCPPLFCLAGVLFLAGSIFARTVARRAEREIASLATEEPINKFAMHFINRLSDHLFVLARVANDNGNADILWVPGAQTGKQK